MVLQMLKSIGLNTSQLVGKYRLANVEFKKGYKKISCAKNGRHLQRLGGVTLLDTQGTTNFLKAPKVDG